MKRKLSVLFLLIVVFFGTCYTAYGLLKEKEVVIREAQVDVTGDGTKDVVVLKGTKDDRGDTYFNHLTIYVTDGNSNKTSKLPLNMDGFGPTLSFGYLNGDGTANILVSAATGGSGGTYNYAIVTAKNNQLHHIPVPDPMGVSGKYLDGYKAEIKVGNQKPFILDLSNRKQTYDEMGVYENGKLVKPVDVLVDPYSDMQIVTQNGSSVLQGTQRVSGFAHYDSILDVVSTWTWDGTHWNLEKVETKAL